MTVLLQPRSTRATSGIQLSLFGDEPDTPASRTTPPDVDALAPMRGIIVSLSLALLIWAAVVLAVWAALS